MEALRRLFPILVVALSSVAGGGQDSAPDYTSLNGKWELAGGPQIGKVRIFGILLRVDGDKIFGSLDFDLICHRADGQKTGSGWQLHVQGDIAPDGSFSFTNEYPLPGPDHTVLVHGVVPAGDPDEWSGSFSISEIKSHDHSCPAASGNFVAIRSQQASGVYSGEVKVVGTGETAWVTVELSPGGLIQLKGGKPPLDRVIGIDAKVTVGATTSFKGGTFSTDPPRRGWINSMSAGGFTAHFPDDQLVVSGMFSSWHDDQITVFLIRDSTSEARWEARGELTRQ